MQQIERAAREMWSNGACQEWMANADPNVHKVAADVNGPLLELLASSCDHHDIDAINLFRSGGVIVGDLHRSGNGKPLDAKCDDPNTLLAESAVRNQELLSKLKGH